MTDISPSSQTEVNLDNCAREPIHVPGAIQPRGVLLHLRPRDLRIVQVSANTAEVLGHRPEALVDRPLESLIGTTSARARRARVAPQVGPRAPNPRALGRPPGSPPTGGGSTPSPPPTTMPSCSSSSPTTRPRATR